MQMYATVSLVGTINDMQKMLKSLTLCFALCASGAAYAQPSAAEITYNSCAVCHGDGQGEGAIPAIRGQKYEALLGYMTSLGGPSDTSTIMHRFTAGLTVPEMEDLAQYISTLEGKGP